MAGRLGRYMSMESGPNAASMASTGRKTEAKIIRVLRETEELGAEPPAASGQGRADYHLNVGI